MAALPNGFEAWRLSRIAEEADAISFSSSTDDGSSASGLRSRNGTLERKDVYARSNASGAITAKHSYVPPTTNYLPFGSSNIYSNVTVVTSGGDSSDWTTNDGHDVAKSWDCDVVKNGALAESQSRDALRFMKEKYDSLGKIKVKKPSSELTASLETCNISTSDRKHVDVSDVIVTIVKNDVTACVEIRATAARRTISSESLASAAPLSIPPTKKYASVNVGHKLSSRSSYDAEQSYVSPFSDGCLFPLTPTTSPFSSSTVVSSVSDGVLSETISGGSRTYSHPALSSLTSKDLQQVEIFYSSHKTTVSVCPCMAELYTGNIKSLAGTPSPPSFTASNGGLDQCQSRSSQNDNRWIFLKSGIPVLVLDSGESRRKRRLHIVVAEKGTGFTLWRDTMDHLSEYTIQSPTFHTMYLSNDHGRVVGFSFDDPSGAAEFYKNLRHMTSDSSDKSVLNLSDGRLWKKKATKDSKTTKPKGRLSKAAISQPCCFTHVTQLDGQNLKTVLRSSGLWQEGPTDNSLSKCERTDVNGIIAAKIAGIKHKS